MKMDVRRESECKFCSSGTDEVYLLAGGQNKTLSFDRYVAHGHGAASRRGALLSLSFKLSSVAGLSAMSLMLTHSYGGRQTNTYGIGPRRTLVLSGPTQLPWRLLVLSPRLRLAIVSRRLATVS